MRIVLHLLIMVVTLIGGCGQKQNDKSVDSYKFSNENHLSNIKMLTDEGENAKAYFSPDEQNLIFQSHHGNLECDQIFTMDINGSKKTHVSTGEGRTTCSYFLPDQHRIIYASTHGANKNCPPPPDFSQGYVWKVYNTFDLYISNTDGSNPVVLVPHASYDTEATVSPISDKIVFTSQRNGDLDIYSMNMDGSGLEQITFFDKFDGFPMFSSNGKKLVFASNRFNKKQRDTNVFNADWIDWRLI